MKEDHRPKSMSFNESGERIDTFLTGYMKESKSGKLWDVFKMLGTISHGQTVEWGYSINKDLLVENMVQRPVTALRTVYNSVSAIGMDYIELLTPNLKCHVKSARRYQQ